MSDQRTLYMIGNAHIDPVWLWQWQDGLHEVRATLRSALARMDEYEDFIFTCDSVAYLAWVERVEPELFQAIAKRVAEGRFVVVGGWWIEPDCNLPHGESLVRQGLYAQHFLWDRFGLISSVGCNVDPFGHAATLPQILSKLGMRGYTFLRPEPKEKSLPGQVFWWQAADGSRVLAYRIPYGYCSPGDGLDSFVEHALERAEPDDELMIFYGVGNHGGGPTRQNLDSIAALDAAPNGLRLRLAEPAQYFERAARRPDLPTYVGDLQHHAVGCYSAHSGIKSWNRRAEHLLMAAERWSTVAAHLGGPVYPAQDLAQAWEMVLFNQFHDTLAGTAIISAYQDARDQYGHASSVAAGALNLAAQSVSSRAAIDQVDGTVPIAVFNPLPWAVEAAVELELEGTSVAEVRAFDESDGTEVPVQRLRSQATLGGRHRRLALLAQVPGLGYHIYRLCPEPAGSTVGVVPTPAPLAPEEKDGQETTETEETGGVAANAARPDLPTPAGQQVPQHANRPLVMENEHLRVEIDPATGWLRSLFDQERSVELAPAVARAHTVVHHDPSDTWSHDVVSYDNPVGCFEPMSTQWCEDGPVRQCIEVESTFGRSRMVERFLLGRRSRALEVRVTLDWHEQLHTLKLRFPVDLQEAKATFSVPYGCLDKPTTGSEEPAQAWVDVTGRAADGRPAGLSVLNDAKYGYDVQGAEVGMTAARSPVFAWHDPQPLDPRARYDYLDQGRQDFTYVLVPHGGDWAAAGVPRQAEELNERLFALPEHAHPGGLPVVGGFAEDGGGAVVFSVLKRAEDGKGVIARAYESSGQAQPGRLALSLLGREVTASYAPGEIKTFLFPDDPAAGDVVEVNLLEWRGTSGS